MIMNLYYEYFTKNKRILSFFMVMSLYLLSYLFFSVIFEDGDDIAMQQIIQGAITGKPDVHLVFINVIIGYILKPFYEFNNQIYWYSFMMVLFQFIALSIIIHCLLLNKIKWYGILIILFFSLYFIVRLQFTSVSGLLAIAGMLMLNNSISTNSGWFYFVSFLLLSFSMLLRFEMFLLTFTICSFFLLSEHLSKLKYIIISKIFLFFSVFFLIFLVFSVWINFESYNRDKEWKYFYEYNSVRGRFNDNPNSANLKEEFKKKSLKRYELDLARNFVFPNTYDLKKISILLEQMRPDVNQKIINVYFAIRKIPIFLGLLFLSLIAFLSIRKKFYFQVFPIGLVFLFFVYISFEHYLKPRVLYPIILAIVIFTILSKNTVSLKKISIGLLLLGIFNVYNFTTSAYTNKSLEIPRNKFIILLSPYRFSVHPFKLNDQNNYSNLIRRGWLTNSPLYLNTLREKGLKVNQHLSWIDNEILNENVLYHIKMGSSMYNNITEYLFLKNKKLVPTKLNSNLYKIENNIINQ